MAADPAFPFGHGDRADRASQITGVYHAFAFDGVFQRELHPPDEIFK